MNRKPPRVGQVGDGEVGRILAEGRRGQGVAVLAHDPKLDTPVCEGIRGAIANHWPEALACFVTDLEHTPEPASYRATAYSGRAGEPSVAAMAVAESVRSGTLDDLDAVRVTVDGRQFSVGIVWAGDHATARILDDGAAPPHPLPEPPR